MKKLLILLAVISIVYASHENVGISPEARALSESNVSKGFGISSLFTNPAGILSGGQWEAMISYERPYGSSSLGDINSVNLAFKFKGFGLALSEYYKDLEGDYTGRYAEGMYGLSYADDFGPLVFGVNLVLYKFQEPRFGTDYTPGVDFGLLSRTSDWVGAGVFFKNVFKSKIRGEELPQCLDAGIHVSIQDLSTTFISLRMAPAGSIVFNLGEEVNLQKGLLKVRGSISYGEDVKKAGFGIGIMPSKNFSIDYAFSTNFELSPAHSLGITYGR